MDIYLATEDALGEAFGNRLVSKAGHGLNIAVRFGGRGNGYLRGKLPELIRVSCSIPVLLLTDLDRTKCAPTLLRDWLGDSKLPAGLLLRVAVREAEAWLLADRDGFSSFSGIPKSKLPERPEALEDPKQELLNLVKRYATREIKSELLPAAGSKATIGFGYNQSLGGFVEKSWSLERATQRSDSLVRAYKRVCEIANVCGKKQ